MNNFIDIRGQKFGRLTVDSRAENLNHQTRWLCVCICGRTAIVRSAHLRNGLIRSCGCLHSEVMKSSVADIARVRAREARTSHARSHSSAYNSWAHMMQRCHNPNNPRFHIYGGATPQVKVCETWKTFKGFYADMGDRPVGTTLGRILDITDYAPETAFWMTQAEQNLARTNRLQLLLWASGYEKASS